MPDLKLEKEKEEDMIMKTQIPGFDELFVEGGITYPPAALQIINL